MMRNLLNKHFPWHPNCLLKNSSFAGFLYFPIGLDLRNRSEVHQLMMVPEMLVVWFEFFIQQKNCSIDMHPVRR